MTAPTIAIEIAHGESLDAALTVAAAPGATSPLVDGSVFSLSLAAARDSEAGTILAALRLSSATPTVTPRIDLGAWVDPDITLTLRATDDRMSQIAPGAYIGDLIQERPRPGTLGDQRMRIAIVALTIIGGTGS